MRTHKLRAGLISLCLLALTGCSVTPEPIIVTKTEVVTLSVPAALTMPTAIPEPNPPISRNRDLRTHIEALYMAIGQCNADKREIRKLPPTGGAP